MVVTHDTAEAVLARWTGAEYVDGRWTSGECYDHDVCVSTYRTRVQEAIESALKTLDDVDLDEVTIEVFVGRGPDHDGDDFSIDGHPASYGSPLRAAVREEIEQIKDEDWLVTHETMAKAMAMWGVKAQKGGA